MRLIVDLFRESDGRLAGSLQQPDGRRDDFLSTLDLLRVLEGLDLPHFGETPTTPEPEVKHG